MLVLAGVAGGLGSVSAATDPGVRPVGVYPIVLPGLTAGPEVRPKALLWCRGADLLGVVVPDDTGNGCGNSSPKRVAPGAVLLRDGRCEAGGGTVSFGFLVSRKAWVFPSAGGTPVERTVWLLHRFEGSVQSGQLKGTLVQVDIDHPGQPFQRKTIEAGSLTEQQASFADEAAWRGGIDQAFCVTTPAGP